MGEKRGTKALELWCRRITDGYTGVSVQNMTTSWRDGLAFCAMIHHFRPDLIDFDSLNKNDIYGNNELAFRIAEQHLGIPALLDAEDMASCSVPDRLSILTYLSQFYQTFGGSSPARLAVNRTTETTDGVTEIPESPKEKDAPYMGMRKDLCTVCGLPVFLAEKLVLAHICYHRTCFRCARCNSQLTLGNYYETEEGQYCCETCPDEEISSSSLNSCHDSMFSCEATKTKDVAESIYTHSSDEDSAVKGIFNHNLTELLDYKDVFIPDLVVQTSQLRLNFISSQLVSEEFESPPSPDEFLINKSLSGPQKTCGNFQTVSRSTTEPLGDAYASQSHEKEKYNSSDAFSKLELHSQRSSGVKGASGLENLVNTVDSNHEKLNIDQEAGKELVKSSFHKSLSFNDTSENFNQADKNVHAESKLSLVQKRRMIFESKKDHASGNKIEQDSFKSNTQSGECEKSKRLIISRKATKIIIDDDGDFTDSSENISTDKSKKDSKIVVPDISLSHVRNVSEGLTVNLLDKENLDNQTCGIFIQDNSPKNATKVSLEDNYPENLNPFNSDDEEVEDELKKTKTLQSSRDLTNPFENEEETECDVEEKKDIIPPKPALRSTFNNKQTNEPFLTKQISRRRLTAPQINLNPFWSDEDECASDSEPQEQTSEFTPVPKPRTIKHIQEVDTNERQSDHSNLQTLNSSLRSSQSEISTVGAYKKKKPAPLPPIKKEVCSDQHKVSESQSPTSTGYHDSSVHTTPKTRKTKPAPQPPILPSGTSNTTVRKTWNLVEPIMDEQHGANNKHNVWEDEKTNKDETNRNRQSFAHMSCDDNYQSYVNKSIEGKWKRKKGPAPPCPTPYRRKIKVMSLKDVKMELDEIELQQQGLEKQGVRLEQLIRSKCESRCRSNDVSSGTDVEELVLELFGLVNEKNELFRRQAELMLLRRQQRLEEEHAEVEYQIRCLMSQHESTKTDFDKQKEEALIQRLVEIVERRNEIVDCLEMDRRREIEEDRSIHKHMDLFAAKNKSDSMSNNQNTPERKRRKQNKLKEKAKDIKLKKMVKKDMDKDIDEIELKLKRHTKRKWF